MTCWVGLNQYRFQKLFKCTMPYIRRQHHQTPTATDRASLMPNDGGFCGAFATNGILFSQFYSLCVPCDFMSFCSIFCRGVIKSFASPTFSGESSEWNSEINETPLAARAQPARLTKLCTTTNVDAKWRENSPSFGGAQECAIHEPLFHKKDYKLFLASLPSCSSPLYWTSYLK